MFCVELPPLLPQNQEEKEDDDIDEEILVPHHNADTSSESNRPNNTGKSVSRINTEFLFYNIQMTSFLILYAIFCNKEASYSCILRNNVSNKHGVFD